MSIENLLFMILMVDDDLDDCLLFKEVCEEVWLCNLFEFFENGEQFVDYFKCQGVYVYLKGEFFFGIILFDLNMLLKDGCEVLEEVKVDFELWYIFIIVLIMLKSEDDILLSYGFGVFFYIVKLILLDCLMCVVNFIGKYWVQIVEMLDVEGVKVDEEEID